MQRNTHGLILFLDLITGKAVEVRITILFKGEEWQPEKGTGEVCWDSGAVLFFDLRTVCMGMFMM